VNRWTSITTEVCFWSTMRFLICGARATGGSYSLRVLWLFVPSLVTLHTRPQSSPSGTISVFESAASDPTVLSPHRYL
jgi:hypothetical protein